MNLFKRAENSNREIFKAYPWLKSTIFPWIEEHDEKDLKSVGLSWRKLKELAINYATSNLSALEVEGALAAHIDGVCAGISLENAL